MIWLRTLLFTIVLPGTVTVLLPALVLRAERRVGALVLAAFHLRVTRYEEPVLRRRFGAAFERYCEEVPRWIPRLPPARGLQ